MVIYQYVALCGDHTADVTHGKNEFDTPDLKNPNKSFQKKLFPCQSHSSLNVDGKRKVKKSI